MEIIVSRLGEKARIKDLIVFTESEEIMSEIMDMIEYVKIQPTNGLSFMDLLLNEIRLHGLYIIESVTGDEINEDYIY